MNKNKSSHHKQNRSTASFNTSRCSLRTLLIAALAVTFADTAKSLHAADHITITNDASSVDVSSEDNVFTSSNPIVGGILSVSALISVLNTDDVTLLTSLGGDINVNTAIAFPIGDIRTLTLNADGSVYINTALSIDGNIFIAAKSNISSKTITSSNFGSISVSLKTTNNSITFSGNSADDGGAIAAISYAGNATVTLASESGSIMLNNNSSDTSGSGGAIYVDADFGSATVTLETGNNGSIAVSDNSGGYNGGAIYANSKTGTATVSVSGDSGDIVFSDNSVNYYGGAIYAGTQSGMATISLVNGAGNIRFSGNSTSHPGGSGGAIYVVGTILDTASDVIVSLVTDSGNILFFDNLSPNGSGGGIGATAHQGTARIALESTSGNIIFSGNDANTGGGIGIRSADATISLVTDSGKIIFSENSGDFGGAISQSSPFASGASSGVITITTNTGDITFSGNTATWEGGAIAASSDTTTIAIKSNSGKITFSENSAGNTNDYGGEGGAIYVSSYYHAGPATIDIATKGDVLFEKNTADDNGGAIYAYSSGDTTTVTIKNTFGSVIFSENSTGRGFDLDTYPDYGNGGAIYAVSKSDTTTVNIAGTIAGGGVIFEKNAASYYGGAIYMSSGNDNFDILSTALTISSHTTFLRNAAGYGGAIYTDSKIPGSINLASNTFFSGNHAIGIFDTNDDVFETGNGGAIRTSDNITVHGNTFFSSNLASGKGGAIYALGYVDEDHDDIRQTILLDAATADIAFGGNKDNVVFNASGVAQVNTGKPNSIYLEKNVVLKIQGSENVYFADPIASGNDGKNSLIKTGTGFVQFYGDNRLNTTDFTGANSVDIQNGTFRIVNDGADGGTESFNSSGAGKFYLASDARLAGYGAITANAIHLSGILDPDGFNFSIYPYIDKDHEDATADKYNYFGPADGIPVERPIGKFKFVGDTTLENATLLVDIDGPDSDVIEIIGDLTISGGNIIQVKSGGSISSILDILTVTGIVNMQGGFTISGTGSDGYAYGRGSQVVTDSDRLSLNINTMTNITLTWTGMDGNGWSNNGFADANWSGFISGVPEETHFRNGDSVIFDSVGTNVLVDLNGVMVDSMTISNGGNWTFSGSEISTNTLFIDSTSVTLESGLSADQINIINSGRLITTTSYSLTAFNIMIDSGATLDLANSIQNVYNLQSTASDTIIDTGATGTLTVQTGSFSGSIIGNGLLEKASDNTLQLSGTNTYTGATVISQGTLALIGNGSIASSSGVSVDSGARFDISGIAASASIKELSGNGSVILGTKALTVGEGNTSTTFSGTISGGVGSVFTKTGSGTLTLTNNNSVNAVSLQQGELEITGSLTAHTFDVANNTTLSLFVGATEPTITTGSMTIGTGTSLNITGISDKNGLSRTLISTTSSFTGDFQNISVGGFTGEVDYFTLQTHKTTDGKAYVADYGLSWYANNNLAHGTFTVADTFTIDVNLNDVAPNSDTSWDGRSLTKKGSGKLVLSGINTYTGETLVDGGTLQIADTGSIVGGVRLNAGSTVTNYGSISGTTGIYSSDVTNIINRAGGIISGNGDAIVLDNGSLVSNAGTIIGNVWLNSNNNLLELEIGSVINGSLNIFGTGSTLRFAGDTGAQRYSDAVTGTTDFSGILQKTGDGMWTLDKALAQSHTKVVAGQLIAGWDASAQLNNAPVYIETGANLRLEFLNDAVIKNQLQGHGVVNATNTGNAPLTLALGTSAQGGYFTGTFVIAGNINNGSLTYFTINNNAASTFADATLQLASLSVTIIDGNQSIGALFIDGGRLDFDISLPPNNVPAGMITATNGIAIGTPGGQIGVNDISQGFTNPVIPPNINLLDQDNSNNGILLASGTITGSIGALTLVDKVSGAALTNGTTVNIMENNILTAVATYDYGISSGTANDGLYASYILRELILQSEGTLTLDNSTSADSTLDALISGTGNLVIAGNGTEAITLTQQSTMTGNVSVQSGTLATGTNDILTSAEKLTLDTGTTFDASGTHQTIKNLDVAAGGNWMANTTVIQGTATIAGNFVSNLINSGTTRLGNVYGAGTHLNDVSESGVDAWGKVDNTGTLYLSTAQNQFGWGNFVNNGHLDFVNAGNKLYVDSLSGAGTIRMDVDAIDSANSDELIIRTGGSVDTNTRQQLQLINVTTNPNAITKETTFAIVSNEDGTPLPDGSISGRVNIGPYTFDAGTSGNNGIAIVTAYTSTAQIIVNTTGTIATGWFSQLDNLLKRMGDLRLMSQTMPKVATENVVADPELQAKPKNLDLWVRSYGQQINTDLGIRGMSNFREYQYGADVGSDKIFASSADSNTALGVFAGYQGTTRRFRDDQSGHGSTDSVYAGVYATWMHDQGWYADAVLKGQYFKSDYDADMDNGDFNNYGIGASIEFGKQWINEKGWFAEPSVQFAYTHIFAEDYDTHMDLRVKSGDVNIYRFAGGARFGKNIALGNTPQSGSIQPYAKLGIEEQVSDGGQIRIAGEKWRPNTDGTYGIFGAGINWQIDATQQIHFDYEAAFGEKYDKPWGVNLGYTVRF